MGSFIPLPQVVAFLLVPGNARLVKGMRTRAAAEEVAVEADLNDDLEPLSYAELMPRFKAAIDRFEARVERGETEERKKRASDATHRLMNATRDAQRRESSERQAREAEQQAREEAERQAREAEEEDRVSISSSDDEASDADIPDQSMSSSDDEAPATSQDKEVIQDLMSLLDEHKHKVSEGMYLALSNSLKRRHDQVGR